MANPTFTASAGAGNIVNFGDTVNLAWSDIAGTYGVYNIERSIGGGAWVPLAEYVQGFLVTDVINDAAVASSGSGNEIIYRIKPTIPGASWTMSNTLYLSGGINIKINGTWKTGSVWVKANGEWKKGKGVYIRQNGSWVNSK